jgi:hypothetical protein
MKITRFQVMDPLDWGVRARPYLIVGIEEPLRNPKRKEYGDDFAVVQYGPFFELFTEYDVSRFNTLDPSHHSTRLIEIKLQVGCNIPIDFFMDLKRARYELKKMQIVQAWSIRLDQHNTERTGGAIYAPVQRNGNRCGWWLEVGSVGERCGRTSDLALMFDKGLPIFLCPTHQAAERREQYERRMSA